MPETHVVTVGLEFSDGRNPSAFICEVFRGGERECRELCAAIPGCSHDGRKISGVQVHLALIEDWEDYLSHVV